MAWDDAVITNGGNAMLNAAALTGGNINVTSAAGGEGTVAVASLMTQTALKNQKQAFSIVSISDTANGKKFKLQIANIGLVTGYHLNQISLWATLDGSAPVFFAILQDETGIAIPSVTEMPEFVLEFNALVPFSNSLKVTVTVDTSALVSQSMLTQATAEVQENLDSAVESINAQLSNKAQIDHTHSEYLTSAPVTSVAGRTGAVTLATSDVTGLQTALDGKAASGHTHAISEVTSLQSMLDGKSSTSHTHTAADVGADKTLIFTNKTVTTSAWATNTTYDSFGYRAAVACTGVTAAMIPSVVFSPTDAMSVIFAPVADSYAGGVYVYASEVPSDTITIPTITATLGTGVS